MNFAEMPEWANARAKFEQTWRAKYPSTMPPDLYPEQPADPLWVEADQMMDEALAQARQDLANDTELQAAAQAPAWIAAAGYVGCPNNHTFPVSNTFCPHCGTGPVPPGIKVASEEAARRLGERAGLAMLRLAGP